MRKLFLFLAFLLLAILILTGCSAPNDTVRSSVQSVVVITDAPADSMTFTPAPQASANQYVLNTNTKKFHKPSCSSVKQMKDKNKKIVSWTRQEIIDQGYSPCGRCHP